MLDHATRLFTAGNLLFLLRGALATVVLTALGCGIGLLAGFALAYLRGSRGPLLAPFRAAAILYVELFRRVPFLVTLFVVLFSAKAFVAQASLFTVAVVAISVMSTAYLAEIMRAGLESVPRQQIEAAEAMNFSRWRTTWMVVLPQAWRVILPAAVAYLVMFVKDTALASQAGVFELMFAGKALANRGLDSAWVFGTVLVIYVLLSWPLARFGGFLERRLSRPPHPTRQGTAPC